MLSLILIPIFSNQWGNWLGKLSPEILLNSLILIIGVGFAEELIFRGWLFEELKNQYGFKKALIFQALVYSIVHVGFDNFGKNLPQFIKIREFNNISGNPNTPLIDKN